jgi:hypothetical protein
VPARGSSSRGSIVDHVAMATSPLARRADTRRGDLPLLLARILSRAFGALLAARIRHERAEATAGKRRRLSVGGITAAYAVVFGSLGLVLVAAVILIRGELPIVPALISALMLWAGLTDHAQSKGDDGPANSEG